MLAFLRAPFPRPKNSIRNIAWVFLIGVLCSIFILIFRPFDIVSQTDDPFLYLVLFSLGLLFSASIYVWDYLLPSIIPKAFKNWTLGKAILWYASMMLFVGGLMFLYKSYLAGFRDFTFQEYVFVCMRVFLISITVSFFVLGILNYIRKGQLSSITSNESCLVTSPQSKPIRLYYKEILFIKSDDNYVDIHLIKDGKYIKEVFRSSLKNMEEQLVHAISPIYRCHRKYLINFMHFNIHDANKRSMTIQLKDEGTVIPVSKQHVDQILQLLQTRP